MNDDANLFLLSWDCYGLESCVNLTALEGKQVWDTLKDDTHRSRPTEVSQIVNSIMLRARANSHRHYEIYTITVEKSITEENLKSWFDRDPQSIAELIREQGKKLYSDRMHLGNYKIV